MPSSFQNQLGANQQLEVDINVAILVDALTTDQEFINRLALEVRNQMLKDSRSMKTLFGQWANTAPTTASLTPLVTPIVLKIIQHLGL
jgi:hypothetical protein